LLSVETSSKVLFAPESQLATKLFAVMLVAASAVRVGRLAVEVTHVFDVVTHGPHVGQGRLKFSSE